jgi:hypothetical protein
VIAAYFVRVSATADGTAWPADPGHREAIDTLLVMAEAEERWGESRRAIDLLDNVERIVGALPRSYERIRRRCLGSPRTAVGSRGGLPLV